MNYKYFRVVKIILDKLGVGFSFNLYAESRFYVISHTLSNTWISIGYATTSVIDTIIEDILTCQFFCVAVNLSVMGYGTANWNHYYNKNQKCDYQNTYVQFFH